ncbi:MAG: DUF4838 domain-containing protein [Victivallales bacterium]|nr:DUF4838 domain-containing protein [Victivallales bacterium]
MNSIEIVRDGQPNATIVVSENNKHLKKAIQDLNEYLFKISGSKLPVKTDKQEISGNMILLGDSKFTAELGLDSRTLKSEEFIIKTYPGKLVLLGNRERLIDGWYKQKTQGVLWAVYEFLEQLGVRWYYPDELWIYVPEIKTIEVSMDIKKSPAFTVRDFLTRPWSSNKLFFRGGNYEGGKRSVHSDAYWAEAYHAIHPEYFATLESGEKALTAPNPNAKHHHRRRWDGHLNYTNPMVLEQFIKDIHVWYDKSDPELIKNWKRCVNAVGLPNELIIPFCPNDGIAIDQSEASKKLLAINKDRNLFGKASDLIHSFSLKLAERLKKDFPKKRLFLAAYSQYSAPPVSIDKMPDNCYVSLCTMQPIANMKDPKIYNEWLGYIKKWHKITGNKVTVRHYSCWPRIVAPFPWAGIYQRWLKDTQDISSGSWICSTAMNKNAVHHLNYYFYGKLNWDPNYDLDKGLKEYTLKMYGPVADIMLEFFQLTQDRWENHATEVNEEQWEPSSKQLYGDNGIYPKTVVNKLRALLAKAANTKGLSPQQQKRIEWICNGHSAFFAEAAAIQEENHPVYFAEKFNNSPVIDADSSDSAWTNIPEIKVNRFIDDGKQTAIGSSVKTGWTDEALYFIADNTELHTDKIRILGEDGGQLWNDDCIELWLDPSGSRVDFMQIIINAKGKAFFRRVKDGKKIPGWIPEGIEYKTRIYPGKKWTLEMKIPFAGIGDKAENRAKWVWNVFRHRTPEVGRYLALCPTMGQTQNLLVFPLLYFIENAKGLVLFDNKFNGKTFADAWCLKGNEKINLDGKVSLHNSNGIRIVDVDPVGILPERWVGKRTIISVCAFTQRYPDFNITPDICIMTRIKLRPGQKAELHARLWYVKKGEDKVRFTDRQLWNGSTEGQWAGIAFNIMQEQDKKHDGSSQLQAGDRLERLRLYFKFPAEDIFHGEIEYVLINLNSAVM